MMRECVNIAIGGTSIEVASDNPAFASMLKRQYGEFVTPLTPDAILLEIDLDENTNAADLDADLRVETQDGVWLLTRGDFTARYDPVHRRGVVRQNINRHSIDSVIRIILTLTLANEGGFLLHSASAIRNDSAFLFAGRSAPAKRALSRLAPPDVCLLPRRSLLRPQVRRRLSRLGHSVYGRVGNPRAPIAPRH